MIRIKTPETDQQKEIIRQILVELLQADLIPLLDMFNPDTDRDVVSYSNKVKNCIDTYGIDTVKQQAYQWDHVDKLIMGVARAAIQITDTDIVVNPDMKYELMQLLHDYKKPLGPDQVAFLIHLLVLANPNTEDTGDPINAVLNNIMYKGTAITLAVKAMIAPEQWPDIAVIKGPLVTNDIMVRMNEYVDKYNSFIKTGHKLVVINPGTIVNDSQAQFWSEKGFVLTSH